MTLPTVKLRVEVTEEAEYASELARATRQILTDPEINREFPGGDLWMVAYDLNDKPGGDDNQFSAIVADLASGRLMEVRGERSAPENWWLRHLAAQRPPSDEEFAWAVKVLTEHHKLGESDEEPYRPMPPLGALTGPDGTADRVVAVGLRSADGAHRVVGVRMIDGMVDAGLLGAPLSSAGEWGLPAGESAPPTAGAAYARVRVWPAGQPGTATADGPVASGEAEGQDSAASGPDPTAVPLWELLVVRPSASSGLNGSGVELRQVDFAGRRVLHRAHLPIMAVSVDPAEDAGGSDADTTGDDGATAFGYRAWMHEEAGFDAQGDEPVPGFRVCDTAPVTVAAGVSGGGPFRGVAIHVDGDEIVVVSQVQAGWYRYVSEWRLSADGTIRPRLTVAATANPRTTARHRHHGYFRFDFDVMAPGENLVQEYNDPSVVGEANWHTVGHEVRRRRSLEHGRYWRVRNIRSAGTYSIVPGAADGEADVDPTSPGAGDVWILRYQDDEIDDGQGFTTDPALVRPQLDRFVSGEPVRREDVVLWYATHLELDPSADPVVGPAGPDLVPGHWVRVASEDVFGHVSSEDSYRP